MCHEILKEEEEDDDDDDEVSSTDDISNKKHLDDLLDEQNGNTITAKLTNLTLNENNGNETMDTVAGVNGNTIPNESDRLSVTTKLNTKKKSKKGTNSIKLASTDSVECDSNDNKLEDGSNTSALDASDDQSSIKDDVVNVNA